MAPKQQQQTTLGYVKSSQTTLGKFFGKPGGAKPQQTKLAFAVASARKAKEAEEAKDEPAASGSASAKPKSASKKAGPEKSSPKKSRPEAKAESGVEEEEHPAEKKRSRGRPRKSPEQPRAEELASKAESDVSSEVETPLSKAHELDDGEDGLEGVNDEGDTKEIGHQVEQKRPRGKPRKSPGKSKAKESKLKAEQLDDVDGDTEELVSKAEEPEVVKEDSKEIEQPAEKKRSPRKPRKALENAKADEPKAEELDHVVDVDADEPASKAEKPEIGEEDSREIEHQVEKKRPRGRPRKAPENAKAEEPKAKPEELDDDEDDAPVSKRVRRTPKRVEEDEDEDEVMADAEPAKPGKRSTPKKASIAPPSPKSKKTQTKKAQPKEDEDEDEFMADAEPVKPSKLSKKASIAPPSPKSTKTQSKKAQPKEDEDEDESMADAEPAKSSKTSKQLPKKVSASATSPKSKKSQPKREEVEDVQEMASASDIEEAVDEQDEPKAAKKAREKLQTKLKTAVAKDPYPDWKEGAPVPYAALCTTFSLIEMTTKRLEITEHCSLFLRQVLRLTPEDFHSTVLLMINKLAPDYAGIELGIGESLIMKAIGEATGRSLQTIKQDQKETGDLGLVAIKSKSKQGTMFKPKALTVRGVHKGLMDIATANGNGAQGKKVDYIKKLLAAADAHSKGKVDFTKDKGGPSEAKFIVRFLEGKLRLGLAEKTVLVSIAQAMIIHEMGKKGNVPSTSDMENATAILKTVYSELPSWEVIVPAMLKDGIMKLRESCNLRPGVPLKPMLAKPTKAITEVLDRFENQQFTCEYKYDGERAQIHYVAKDRSDEYVDGVPGATKEAAKGVASIFSRNSEDLSKKYPDILAKLHTWVKDDTKSFVLDCETVAWDVETKKVLPFQQLMTRKKKDVKIEDVKVKVCVFAFDLLFFNGEAVVKKSLRERRELLHKAFTPVEGEFAFATHMNGQELDEIQVFLDESVKASCEGLMVKMLDGPESGYEPSKRSQNWLKIKKDYLSGVGDSLDLVVLGAYYGKGKRTSVYGAFLLACYNPSAESYETVCNIGTGFSEQVLEELHKSLSEIVINRPKPFYSHSAGGQHQPDVWFEPKYVWEVKTADLTLSPRYKAGCKEGVDPSGEKGISLRFPRFIKLRDDKKPDEATASRQVAEMYRKQESVTKNKGPSVDDDFEY